jgi:DNA-binding NarL/FixJ family response regulator
LALSAHAAHARTKLSEARSSTLTHQGCTYLTVSAPRPEGCLQSRLSRAEFAVVRLLLEGKSHAEMSAERRTSMRTIANQLAAAFSKLGVSGRADLIRELVRASDEDEHWQPAPVMLREPAARLTAQLLAVGSPA